MKKIRKPQKPKQRNWVAKQVRDPQGPYRPRSERDRTRYSRKPKHRNSEEL